MDDFFFIKDNHISKADNIVDTIDQVRMFYPKKKITVEVDKISQLKKILNKKIDVVLDNKKSDSKNLENLIKKFDQKWENKVHRTRELTEFVQII